MRGRSRLSLPVEFEDDSVFRRTEYFDELLEQAFDRVITWGGPLRAPRGIRPDDEPPQFWRMRGR